MQSLSRHIALLICFLMAACLVCSCKTENREDTAYIRFVRINGNERDAREAITFEPETIDSASKISGPCKIELVLRFSGRDIRKAVPLLVTLEDENGIIRTDSITDYKSYAEKKRRQYGLTETRLILDTALMVKDGFTASIMPMIPKNEDTEMIDIGLIISRNQNR